MYYNINIIYSIGYIEVVIHLKIKDLKEGQFIYKSDSGDTGWGVYSLVAPSSSKTYYKYEVLEVHKKFVIVLKEDCDNIEFLSEKDLKRFSAKKKPFDMTISEIEKELGYKIKIKAK